MEHLVTTLTISMTDDRLEQLQQLAHQLNVSADELVRISIDELLSRPKEDFLDAAQFVLDKNEELYQRLA